MRNFTKSLRDLIALEGPISLERTMAMSAAYYYATRDPFGAAGDFTTSPEISQVFGELIGLWLAVVWTEMGKPNPVDIVELGPGRGTLMADALRAAGAVPDFLRAASVHLVETSPLLQGRQKVTLASCGKTPTWHQDLETLPGRPTLFVANEFFDALPIRQYVATEEGWRERLVGLVDQALTFGLKNEIDTPLRSDIPLGSVREVSPLTLAVGQRLARHIQAHGGAALAIDYGYWGPALGDTLQSLKGNRSVDPLTSLGEADITAHVDFHALAQIAADSGLSVFGPLSQGDFLESLGLKTRVEALSKRATKAQAEDLHAGAERLIARGKTSMGELFKVLAFAHPNLFTLPGLPPHPMPARI